MNDTLKIQSVRFVDASDIIPKDWGSWFWAALSESSTVTFGDNDHSLISAERFRDELENVLDFEEEVDPLVVEKINENLLALVNENIYISL
jgi:hypothetical protein